jgi:hypothetical protein
MFQKTKDVVMTIGSSIIQKSKKAIEGEYLGKGGLIVGGTALSTSVSAAVPTEVSTAITTAATDVATVGAAVIVVMVGIKVFKWLMRAL